MIANLDSSSSVVGQAHLGKPTLPFAVNLIGVGQVDLHACAGALMRCGIANNAQAPLHIVVVNDYLDNQLEQFNRRAIAGRLSWLLVKPSAITPWIGPLFEAGTACWECLAYRLRINGFLSATPDTGGASPVAADRSRLGNEVAFDLAMLESAKWIESPESSRLSDKLIVFDLERLHADYHPVVRRLQCNACGMAAVREAEIELIARPKIAAESGYRTCSAEQTLERLSKHVSAITGIVSGLAQSSAAEQSGVAPMRAFVAKFRGHPLRDDAPTGSRLELAFGKGTTDVQAKVSCIAEAVERHCGAYDSSDKTLIARYADLTGAVHPSELLMFSANQYDNRLHTNRDDDLFNWVPHRFNDEQQIEWTAAWSLRDGAIRYLPSAFCYYYYPEKGKPRFCIANSNGCASGNTIEEATLQALFEVIERDCVGIWWYNMLRLPEVDLQSYNDPYFDQIISYLNDKQRCLRVIDLTNDLSIPTFAAVSWRSDGRSILFGTGTHLEPKLAITRAITELNQRLGFACRIDQGLEVKTGPAETRIASWLRESGIEDHAYLEPRANHLKQRDGWAMYKTDDLLTDIRYIVDKLSALGLDTIILNMSKPDLPLSTVRITVPGLRHSWARFGPGRLYDVPVKMGWLASAAAERDLNPRAYFV